jgi:hypothetical protein
MRFLLPDPLGNNRHPQMFHSSGFAIAAGVVAVAAAGTAAGISMSAADRAKKAQGKAAAAYKKGQRKVQGMIDAVEAPQYDLGAMIGDAAQISEYNRQQVELFQPGATALRARSAQQLNRAMDVTDQYLRGEIPQDVREQTMRNIAEFGGAGFNPATAGRAGGFQAAQALVPRQFGLTSLDLQRTGLAATSQIQGTAQNWQQLARAFTADPLDVGRVQLGFQTAAAEVGLQKARMTAGVYENIYGANKENIAASYAAQQAVGQGVSDIGKATSGALAGYSNVMGGFSYGGQSGGMGGGGGGSSNPYYGSLGTGYGSQPIQFQSRADYASQVSNPSTQYLGGQSRLDTDTPQSEIYKRR